MDTFHPPFPGRRNGGDPGHNTGDQLYTGVVKVGWNQTDDRRSFRAEVGVFDETWPSPWDKAT
jgi:hypothetical protein